MARHEDYERTNAREWDMNLRQNNNSNNRDTSTTAASALADDWEVVTARNKKPEESRQGKQSTSPKKKGNWKNAKGHVVVIKDRPPPPNPLVDVSIDAECAWRKHERPNGTIKIPDVLALQDKRFETIAEQNGAFISTDHTRGVNGWMPFGIWGDAKAVAATRSEIDAWIREWRQASTSKFRRAETFAKVKSLTPALQEQKEKEWQREVTKQKYRQNPPALSEFGAIGTFHWPTQQFRPEDCFGSNCEALDDIRMSCKCYVVFNKQSSVFEVSGKAKEVKEGVLRLRKTYFQIVARSIPTVRIYSLHWPNATGFPSHVHLQPYEHTKAASNDNPGTVGNIPLGDGQLDAGTPFEIQTVAGEGKARALLMLILKKLHYYRGSVKMRIRLGTFLVIQFRQPKDGHYELEEYEDMIKESQFIGQVTEELGDRSKELTALDAFQSSDDLFQPEDAITENLAAVRPAYSVTFTFADDGGDICLTIIWTESKDAGAAISSFEENSRKWTRLERDTNAAVVLLDVSLCDLNTGMAWQFDLQSSQPIDESKLPKDLVDFGQSIKIDPKAALQQAAGGGSNTSFIVYRPHAKLKRMRQCLSYCYHIRAKSGFVTDYTLDLTRFQDRSFPEKTASSFIAPSQPTIYEARWSVSVSCTEWGTKFAKNENLKVGEVADWEDDVETWFPRDLDKDDEEPRKTGFDHLMKNLKRIGKLVREMKQDDLLGGVDGMTVG